MFNERQSTDNQINTVCKEVQHFSKQHQDLSKQISDLTSRVNQLVTFNNRIQGQIEDINAAIHKKSYAEAACQPAADNVSSPQFPSPVQFSAITAVDEYADRKRRKANLIIHNLPESGISDRTANISEFENIVNELKIEGTKVVKAVRLGTRKDNRPRLLLITMDCERS